LPFRALKVPRSSVRTAVAERPWKFGDPAGHETQEVKLALKVIW